MTFDRAASTRGRSTAIPISRATAAAGRVAP
jgi:hypothetical protein